MALFFIALHPVFAVNNTIQKINSQRRDWAHRSNSLMKASMQGCIKNN